MPDFKRQGTVPTAIAGGGHDKSPRPSDLNMEIGMQNSQEKRTLPRVKSNSEKRAIKSLMRNPTPMNIDTHSGDTLLTDTNTQTNTTTTTNTGNDGTTNTNLILEIQNNNNNNLTKDSNEPPSPRTPGTPVSAHTPHTPQSNNNNNNNNNDI